MNASQGSDTKVWRRKSQSSIVHSLYSHYKGLIVATAASIRKHRGQQSLGWFAITRTTVLNQPSLSVTNSGFSRFNVCQPQEPPSSWWARAWVFQQDPLSGKWSLITGQIVGYSTKYFTLLRYRFKIQIPLLCTSTSLRILANCSLFLLLYLRCKKLSKWLMVYN